MFEFGGKMKKVLYLVPMFVFFAACGEKKAALGNVGGGKTICTEYAQRVPMSTDCTIFKCSSACPEKSPLDNTQKFTKCEFEDGGQKAVRYIYLGGDMDMDPKQGEFVQLDVYRNMCKRLNGKFSMISG